MIHRHFVSTMLSVTSSRMSMYRLPVYQSSPGDFAMKGRDRFVIGKGVGYVHDTTR